MCRRSRIHRSDTHGRLACQSQHALLDSGTCADPRRALTERPSVLVNDGPTTRASGRVERRLTLERCEADVVFDDQRLQSHELLHGQYNACDCNALALEHLQNASDALAEHSMTCPSYDQPLRQFHLLKGADSHRVDVVAEMVGEMMVGKLLLQLPRNLSTRSCHHMVRSMSSPADLLQPTSKPSKTQAELPK